MIVRNSYEYHLRILRENNFKSNNYGLILFPAYPFRWNRWKTF